jgi:hypothetical protein
MDTKIMELMRRLASLIRTGVLTEQILEEFIAKQEQKDPEACIVFNINHNIRIHPLESLAELDRSNIIRLNFEPTNFTYHNEPLLEGESGPLQIKLWKPPKPMTKKEAIKAIRTEGYWPATLAMYTQLIVQYSKNALLFNPHTLTIILGTKLLVKGTENRPAPDTFDVQRDTEHGEIHLNLGIRNDLGPHDEVLVFQTL